MKTLTWKLALLLLLGAFTPGAAQNLARNGTFSTYPTPIRQTLELVPGTNLGDWTSSVPYAGTGIYPPDTRVSVQLGGVNYFNSIVRQGTFPGDPVWNVPPSTTWLYSNGNNTGVPYTIWRQTVNLNTNSGYYFACYTSNAIAPGRVAEEDPQLDLLVNGTLFGSFRVYDDADPLSGHGGLDLWDRRQIFFRSGTSTSADLSLRDSQLSTFGDDFALTAVSVTPNLPPVAENVTTPAIPQNSAVAVGILPLVGSDPNGINTLRQSPGPYTLLTVPPATQGVLTLAGSATPLVAGTTLTLAQISQLQFRPAPGFTGNATFTYQLTDEGDLTSNVATYTIPVVSGPIVDLAVSKQAYLGPYRAGAATTFIIRVVNQGTTGATGVVARDLLPVGLSFVSGAASVGSFNPSTGLWTIGDLGAGSSVTLTIVATTSLASTGTTNIVTVSGNQADAVPENNRASRTIYPGAAYADDFEGRVAPDYCVDAARMSLNGAGTPISGNNSYVTEPLNSNVADAYYRSPILRFTNFARITFSTKLTGTTGTVSNRTYQVRLLNINNTVIATLRGSTAFPALNTVANEAIDVNLGALGLTAPAVLKVEVRFTGNGNNSNDLQAALDNFLVLGAGPATRVKDGSNCDANLLPTPQNVTQAPSFSNRQPSSPINALQGTDPDGTVVAFLLNTVPDPDAQGILFLDGVPVQPGQEISRADAGRLSFDPQSGYVGTATFTYFAIDDSGESSPGTATFSIPVVDQPLPVELVRFEAQASGRAVRLSWATASELNSARFEVQRSTDGRTFTQIGTVAAAGTSNQPHTYGFVDEAAASAGRLLYYRLRQVDLDGTAAFSQVRSVSLSTVAALVYPNPATTAVDVDLRTLPTGTYTVQLLTLTGQTAAVYQAAGGQLTPLHVGAVVAGTYVLRISGPGGSSWTSRWTKL